MIIDDEIGILNLLSRFLKRRGFEVHTAINLSEGKNQLEKIDPDFLFLDVNLPDGNGLESLPHLKDTYPSLTVIMMSAFDHGKMRSIAKSQGALAFLSKPFSLAEIDQIIV
ncbi:response regulator [Mongoliibacter ruber]|uniref:response regulator n=1 Tax=Mongoliibacter ruber TaxID=1750599 RepID=UPI001475B291|nr:response regulator [Mongoliibacter ruber]